MMELSRREFGFGAGALAAVSIIGRPAVAALDQLLSSAGPLGPGNWPPTEIDVLREAWRSYLYTELSVDMTKMERKTHPETRALTMTFDAEKVAREQTTTAFRKDENPPGQRDPRLGICIMDPKYVRPLVKNGLLRTEIQDDSGYRGTLHVPTPDGVQVLKKAVDDA